MLAALHDRELTAETVAALREVGFPTCLGLMPAGQEAIAAWRAMAAGMAELPEDPGSAAYDRLASEYAAIYLTGTYGASPCESVWTDDEHLLCQAAMFQWRDIHAAAGLAAKNWRQRPDDHLVLQLLHIAHVTGRLAATPPPATADEIRRLARVLDEHTLRWLPSFAARVAARSESPFYAGLAILTVAWTDSLRELLARELGEPRPSQAEIETRFARGNDPPPSEPCAFLPGAQGPSW